MRYTSERVLEESLSMKDVLLPGLNIALNSDFTPDSGKLNIGLTSTFRCPSQLIYRRVIQSVSVYQSLFLSFFCRYMSINVSVCTKVSVTKVYVTVRLLIQMSVYQSTCFSTYLPICKRLFSWSNSMTMFTNFCFYHSACQSVCHFVCPPSVYMWMCPWST